MYGVGGERDLAEHTLDHLSGYHDSRPVRVGNDAWTQVQLDVLGEVLDAAHVLRDQLGDLDETVKELLVVLADRAAERWTEPDAGMWEARDKQRQYVSSKVMCWVALDRAIALADRLGPGADSARWAIARAEIHAAVLSQAWSSKAGAYTGAFGSDDLDASVLLLPLVGFLPATDERMRATIEAIASELSDGGLVRRWPDDPSGFLICTFWLVECLALAGELRPRRAMVPGCGRPRQRPRSDVGGGRRDFWGAPRQLPAGLLPRRTHQRSVAAHRSIPAAYATTRQHQGDVMTTTPLEGKVALVTGSDSGIGQATAIAFARRAPTSSSPTCTTPKVPKATVQEVEAAGREAIVVQVDVSEEAQVDALFDQAVERFDSIDILMNNAGVDASGTEVADLSTEVWDKAIRTNRVRTVLLLPPLHPAAQASRRRRQDHQRHVRARRHPERRWRRLRLLEGRHAQC
ncbi:MAG: SDR family NAD(P)-dependent oxidoreductase [Ilumatobacteraceae bacterium]